ERQLISKLIIEAKEAFGGRLLRGDGQTSNQLGASAFASEQMCRVLLETLLITLVRQSGSDLRVHKKLSALPQQNREESLFACIHQYMMEHLCEPLSIGRIAAAFSISPAHLSQLFKQQTGFGIIEYLNNCKVDTA